MGPDQWPRDEKGRWNAVVFLGAGYTGLRTDAVVASGEFRHLPGEDHVAGDTERIEQDIAQAREDLAKTLDTLAERVSPQRIAADAKSTLVSTLNTPAVKFALAGVGVVIVAVVIRKVVA